MSRKTSGERPFAFSLCEDLYTLPEKVVPSEVRLHGGFAVDKRPGHGQIYYGMPGCGLLRISPDLTSQALIELPPELAEVNFHSTKIGGTEAAPRLFLPANNNGFVAVVTLDGAVEYTLSRPEFAEYADAETPYKPTDTVALGEQLLVADGYGANYISTADLPSHSWRSTFGGKTTDPHEDGKFGTAHGFNLTPGGGHLAIADRLNSRIQIHSHDGHFHASHPMPAASRPCGIDFVEWQGRSYAVVGSLDDPEKERRPAPIYILDGENYQILSIVRPKEELGVALADHLHNVIWHVYNGRLFLVCQAWNPGHYFVLEMAE
ncbi:MAG: hypothetical protein HY328_10265 [Chloroflexi bacterium]|nr:hypothetical protein [Chloroflexota bacterium]